MKKVKVYLMMSILAMALCACGSKDSNAKITESDLDNMSETELEEVIEQELEKLDELEETEVEQKVEEEVDKEEVVQEQSFECLPEMLNASLEDCLLQVDNTILHYDVAMTLNEAIVALQNSGVEYTFKVDDADYNPSMLVGPQAHVVVKVYKNGNHYFSLWAKNYSNDTVSGDSEKVIFFSTVHESTEYYGNSYYCKGIRLDGNGHTYGTIKELLKDYTEQMEERSAQITVDGEWFQGIEMKIDFKKDDLNIKATLHFKSEDGSCVRMFCNTSRDGYY